MYLYFVAYMTESSSGFGFAAGHTFVRLSEKITSKNFKNSFVTMIQTIKRKTKREHISIVNYQLIPDEEPDK